MFSKIAARSRTFVVFVAAAAVVAGLAVGLPAAPAYAAPAPIYPPPLLINQSALEAPAQVSGSYYSGGMFSATDAERAAVETLEAQAVANALADHGLPAGDASAVRSWARSDADANFWALILRAVDHVHAGTASATEQLVNQWLSDSLKRQSILSTDDAGLEYTKWAGLGTAAFQHLITTNATEAQLAAFLSTTPNPYTGTGSASNPGGNTDGGYCAYQSPAPDQGDYTTNIFGSDAPQTCYVPCTNLVDCGPPVPAASQFATWGTADYENATLSSFGSSNGLSATAQSASLLAAANTVASGLVGEGTAAALDGTQVALRFLQATQPYTLRTLTAAAKAAGEGVFEAAPQDAVAAAEEAGETAIDATEEAISAANAFGVEVAATGIGVILTAIIFAITTAIQEGLKIVGAQNVPGQIATMIDSARTSTPDPYAVAQSSPGSLFAFFINATLPQPSSGSCDDSLTISSVEALGTPCINATPIPAPAVADPNWIITPTGGASTANATLTLKDASSGLTPSYRLHGNWVVTTATIAGTTASTEGLSFHYSDWSGAPHTAWVYADRTPPSFVTVADSALGPDFDVDTCQQHGTCAVTTSIEVVSPTGADETVSLTPGAAAPTLPAGPCAVGPTCDAVDTTTAVAGPTSLAVGQSATYTAAIDGDASVNGTADFVAGAAAPGCAGVALQTPTPGPGVIVAGKIATCTITFAKAGTYFVFATYNGATTYQPSQGEITVNVGTDGTDGTGGTGGTGGGGDTRASTNTGVSASLSTVVGGQPDTFTATVDTGGSGLAPGGTVAFKAGSRTLCAAALLSETAPYTATCPYAFDLAGPATITTTYSGDPGTQPSSGTVAITVNTASTTTTVTASTNSPAVGQPVTYTATVTVDAPGGGIPQNGIDFSGGASCTVGVVTQTPPFIGTCTVTYTAPGPQDVEASFAGDLALQPSSGGTSVLVGSPATTTAGAPSAGPYSQGQPITDTALVSSAAGTPTGGVSFSECGPLEFATGCVPGGSSLGAPVSLDAAGSATSAPFTPSHAGVYCFRADYNGDADFAASSDGASTQCVSVPQIGQAVTFSSSPPSHPAVGGAYLGLAATGGASGNPINFASATPDVCTVTATSVAFDHAGMCTVQALQSGSDDYSAGSMTQSFAIDKADQTITITSTPTTTLVGDTYALAATGGSSGNDVTFSSATPATCTMAGSTATFVAAGTCTIDAAQAGNDDYNPAALATQDVATTNGDLAAIIVGVAVDKKTVLFSGTVTIPGGPTIVLSSVTCTKLANGKAITAGLAAGSYAIDPASCSYSGFSAPGYVIGSVDATFTAEKAGISTASLPAGRIGHSYEAKLKTEGGSGGSSFSVSAGSLPQGLKLSSSGELTGTPTVPGTYPFSVTARWSQSLSSTWTYAITVPGLAITAKLPAGVLGHSYDGEFGASAGKSPLKWAVTSGALPPGLKLSSSGEVEGKPTTPGSYSFAVTVSDSSSPRNTASGEYAVTVPGLAITTAKLPAAALGHSYEGKFGASAGASPLKWAVTSGALPPGLKLSSSGEVEGKPTTPGSYSFTVTVSDSSSPKNTISGQYAIAVPELAITTASLKDGKLHRDYDAALAVNAGASPKKWATAAGALPPGIKLTSSGSLTGTPTKAGSYTFTVTVTDGNGNTATTTLHLTVD